MTEQTVKQCIQDIYCDTLEFLRSKGYSHDDSRCYAFSIAKLYTDTIIELANCGCFVSKE